MMRGAGNASDLNSILDQIAALQTQQAAAGYSAEPDSGYQKKKVELEALLNRGMDAAGNNADSLLKLAKVAGTINADTAISAARRATEVHPSSDSYLLLANVLTSKYIWLQGDERVDLMKQAEKAARFAIKTAKPPSAEMFYRLGDTLEDEGQYTEAEAVHGSVMNMTRNSSSDLY